MEQRKVRYSDLAVNTAGGTLTFTIPVGGGSATGSISLSNFGLKSKIEGILNVKIKRQAPVTNDVYMPEYGINSSQNAVGITLYAGTGTTLIAEVTVFGI